MENLDNSGQETSRFRWSVVSEEATVLLANGELTDSAIAEKLGIARATLSNWKKHPEFDARIKEHLDVYREQVRRRGIAVAERRIAALNDRWLRLQRIAEARADDPSMRGVPGGSTGFLVRTTKGLGSGENFTTVDEYAVDTGLLKELREHEKQAAQELGQWTDRSESTVAVTAVPQITIVEVSRLPPRPEPPADDAEPL